MHVTGSVRNVRSRSATLAGMHRRLTLQRTQTALRVGNNVKVFPRFDRFQDAGEIRMVGLDLKSPRGTAQAEAQSFLSLVKANNSAVEWKIEAVIALLWICKATGRENFAACRRAVRSHSPNCLSNGSGALPPGKSTIMDCSVNVI